MASVPPLVCRATREYVGNFFYAIGVRKLPNWALAILVAIAAMALIHLTAKAVVKVLEYSRIDAFGEVLS